MTEDWSDPEELEEKEELEASLHRFQQMVERQGHAFFDEDEYIYIIDHFMAIEELGMAEKAIVQSLERYPDNVALQLRQVGLLSARQHTDAALRNLRRIDAAHPEADAFSLYEEAVLYLDLQQWEEAEAKFNAVLAMPKSERDEVLQDPNFYNDLSELYETRGKLLMAVTAKMEAIRKKSADPADLNELIRQITETGQTGSAINFFTSRTDEHPLSAPDWFCLGKLQMEAEQYNEAMSSLHNVQALCGENTEATAEIAAIQILTGARQNGEAELDLYLDQNRCSRNERLRWYDQVAQYAYDRSQFTLCTRFCQKAIDTQSDDIYGYLLMALALGESEKYEQGLQVLEKALQFNPDHFDAQLLAGEYLMRTGRMEEAGDMLRNCCVRFPEEDRAWFCYTIYLVQCGYIDEAINLLNHAVASRNNPQFIYRLSNCYFMKGENQLGRFYLNMAYAEDPEGLEDFLHFDENLLNHPEILSFLNEIKFYD